MDVSADITLDPAVSAASAVQSRATNALAAPPTSPAYNSVASGPSPSFPNPRLTVDPSLNRVVLEFFNSSGTLTDQIPSQKQLDAYRLAAYAGKQPSG